MKICPICSTKSINKVVNTPYNICPNCKLQFQFPIPSKTYEASHELDKDGNSTGHLMGDREKNVNNNLAKSIFINYMNSVPGRCLDIGSKYAYLSKCLNDLGNDVLGMDNIEAVDAYSSELGIEVLKMDFELATEAELEALGKFDLITMIHCFEHMEQPLEALRRLKSLLKPNGVLFLRLPSSDVPGIERDYTPGHFTIHPNVHCFSSLLELLVRGKDLFVISKTMSFSGAGQRDLVLKPITKKPYVVAGLIVKNESEFIGSCLKALEPVVDEFVIIDMGSVDNTLDVAQKAVSKNIIAQVYTGDETEARNEYVNIIDSMPNADWILTADADEILLTPNELKRYIYYTEYSVYDMNLIHHKLWKTRKGFKFENVVTPNFLRNDICILGDVNISHNYVPYRS